ncbi:hypothetical protein KZ483_11430 [Paenibacillus sp. sptzw28]|uniref:hypothetical protein n=1 Tax=Paenibacillus sp. sptzw28 TaxID=715179 RepID=UPI001C6EC0FC|nr:hypothetical protein [Paenibacillus sp. sptzw28]QYR23466.1 hypothetical protein KZ483_11430 [Paenibacillus sp. sptzw28]
MHKKYILTALCAILFAAIILNRSIPSEQKYVNWLLEKHNISCVNTNITINCTLRINGQDQSIDWLSRAKTNNGLYLTIKDEYKDEEGNIVIIKSLGILNEFYGR